MDDFARIASDGIGGRKEFLCDNIPKSRDKIISELKRTNNKKTEIKEKMSTKEELYEELERQRKRYAPFLENHAPKISELTEKINLTKFAIKKPHFIET